MLYEHVAFRETRCVETVAEGVQLPAAKSKTVGIHETNFCIDAPKKKEPRKKMDSCDFGLEE